MAMDYVVMDETAISLRSISNLNKMVKLFISAALIFATSFPLFSCMALAKTIAPLPLWYVIGGPYNPTVSTDPAIVCRSMNTSCQTAQRVPWSTYCEFTGLAPNPAAGLNGQNCLWTFIYPTIGYGGGGTVYTYNPVTTYNSPSGSIFQQGGVCQAGYVLTSTRDSCTLPANASDPTKNIGNVAFCPDCLKEQTHAGTNPVNSGTGGKHQREVDYTGIGAYPLNLERNYDSGGTTPTVVEATVWGSSWRSAYDRSIISYSNMTSLITATVKRF